jgi:hypothetical protein
VRERRWREVPTTSGRQRSCTASTSVKGRRENQAGYRGAERKGAPAAGRARQLTELKTPHEPASRTALMRAPDARHRAIRAVPRSVSSALRCSGVCYGSIRVDITMSALSSAIHNTEHYHVRPRRGGRRLSFWRKEQRGTHLSQLPTQGWQEDRVVGPA